MVLAADRVGPGDREQGEVVALAVLTGDAGGGAVHRDGVGRGGGLEVSDLGVELGDLVGAAAVLQLLRGQIGLHTGSGAGDALADELGHLGLQLADFYGHRGLLWVG